MRLVALVSFAALAFPAVGFTAPLTADEAVRIALQKNSSVVQAEASVLTARGGLWSAYSAVLPRASADLSYGRDVTRPSDEFKSQRFFGQPYESRVEKDETTTNSAGINGSWDLLNLSSLSSLRSARAGMSAAHANRRATRSDVALLAKQRFYDVVRSYHLLRVSSSAARLARDDERRVRALFEVGSVSKSDLLKAQVRTSQSQLDSLLADHGIVGARVQLAELLGMAESSLGEVDTTLAEDASTRVVPDLPSVLAEAQRARPDLQAAELRLRSAQQALTAARLSRMPYVSSSAGYSFKSHSKTEGATRYLGFPLFTSADTTVGTSLSTDFDPSYRVTLSLNLDLFDGFATDARMASARSRYLSEREARDALVRNLQGEVRQVLLGYQEAIEREDLARRTIESARENLNLVQQKYNVGSATILDLIDSQVQLQRAEGDLVTSLAAIRVAEGAVDRVRGKSQ